MPVFADDLTEIILDQLPNLLSQKPDLAIPLYHAFLASLWSKALRGASLEALEPEDAYLF